MGKGGAARAPGGGTTTPALASPTTAASAIHNRRSRPSRYRPPTRTRRMSAAARAGAGVSVGPHRQAGGVQAGRASDGLNGAANSPAGLGRARASPSTVPTARLASLAKIRTMPTVVRSSKMASRIASLSTVETWIDHFAPSWKSTVNSVSPSSWAIAAVELKAAAASAEMDTVSSVRETPSIARSWPPRSIRSASPAPESPRNRVRIWVMRVASASWMTRSRGFIACLTGAPEFAGESHAGDGVERVEDSLPFDGRRLEERDSLGPVVEDELQILHRRDVGQVALVVLQDVRDLVEGALVLAEVGLEVAQALDVFAETLELRVGNEHETVDTAQDQPARHVVLHLPRHGVELEPGLEPANRDGRHREKVEVDRAVVAGRQRDHVALVVVGQAAVDVLEVGGLPRETRPVVHDLEVDDLLRVVDDRHGSAPHERAQARRRAVQLDPRQARPVDGPAADEHRRPPPGHAIHGPHDEAVRSRSQNYRRHLADLGLFQRRVEVPRELGQRHGLEGARKEETGAERAGRVAQHSRRHRTERRQRTRQLAHRLGHARGAQLHLFPGIAARARVAQLIVGDTSH